jgi:hypothetical protein
MCFCDLCDLCDFCLSFKFITGFGLGVTLCFLIFYVIYTQDNSLLIRLLHNHTL